MIVLFMVGAILVSAGAILVLLWFVGHAQSTGLVPTTLGLWSIGNMVAFLLNLLFWELLLIGIPLIIVAIVVWLWWRRLPLEERNEYTFRGKRSRSSSGGNAFSFLIFIGFLIKVYLDGNWDVAIATWSFDYLVYSVITVMVWIAIIFGIPLAIGIVWWLCHDMRSGA
ncbi:MAG: hypothetical protein ISF22_07075 [Methanomassiliicoccus sp.]|nr:hypothetical protein [Methanomassiliicoccus sp.]